MINLDPPRGNYCDYILNKPYLMTNSCPRPPSVNLNGGFWFLLLNVLFGIVLRLRWYPFLEQNFLDPFGPIDVVNFRILSMGSHNFILTRFWAHLQLFCFWCLNFCIDIVILFFCNVETIKGCPKGENSEIMNLKCAWSNFEVGYDLSILRLRLWLWLWIHVV